eukprot:TRINITY_DN1253_c0_g1_i1.p1 TRINITY_DN1253_c0_g1~~TRINITY_DN1253_c0_g1_i1.p1  ORF type:complete len:638 (+),score=102.66 TRINITY_DN1253_c0_g1_i1:83-1996(+)
MEQDPATHSTAAGHLQPVFSAPPPPTTTTTHHHHQPPLSSSSSSSLPPPLELSPLSGQPVYRIDDVDDPQTQVVNNTSTTATSALLSNEELLQASAAVMPEQSHTYKVSVCGYKMRASVGPTTHKVITVVTAVFCSRLLTWGLALWAILSLMYWQVDDPLWKDQMYSALFSTYAALVVSGLQQVVATPSLDPHNPRSLRVHTVLFYNTAGLMFAINLMIGWLELTDKVYDMVSQLEYGQYIWWTAPVIYLPLPWSLFIVSPLASLYSIHYFYCHQTLSWWKVHAVTGSTVAVTLFILFVRENYHPTQRSPHVWALFPLPICIWLSVLLGHTVVTQVTSQFTTWESFDIRSPSQKAAHEAYLAPSPQVLTETTLAADEEGEADLAFTGRTDSFSIRSLKLLGRKASPFVFNRVFSVIMLAIALAPLFAWQIMAPRSILFSVLALGTVALSASVLWLQYIVSTPSNEEFGMKLRICTLVYVVIGVFLLVLNLVTALVSFGHSVRRLIEDMQYVRIYEWSNDWKRHLDFVPELWSVYPLVPMTIIYVNYYLYCQESWSWMKANIVVAASVLTGAAILLAREAFVPPARSHMMDLFIPLVLWLWVLAMQYIIGLMRSSGGCSCKLLDVRFAAKKKKAKLQV